jgi:hypothetical protein
MVRVAARLTESHTAESQSSGRRACRHAERRRTKTKGENHWMWEPTRMLVIQLRARAAYSAAKA